MHPVTHFPPWVEECHSLLRICDQTICDGTAVDAQLPGHPSYPATPGQALPDVAQLGNLKLAQGQEDATPNQAAHAVVSRPGTEDRSALSARVTSTTGGCAPATAENLGIQNLNARLPGRTRLFGGKCTWRCLDNNCGYRGGYAMQMESTTEPASDLQTPGQALPDVVQLSAQGQEDATAENLGIQNLNAPKSSPINIGMRSRKFPFPGSRRPHPKPTISGLGRLLRPPKPQGTLGSQVGHRSTGFTRRFFDECTWRCLDNNCLHGGANAMQMECTTEPASDQFSIRRNRQQPAQFVDGSSLPFGDQSFTNPDGTLAFVPNHIPASGERFEEDMEWAEEDMEWEEDCTINPTTTPKTSSGK
eukprot:GHVQ01030014.1.p1 GENE.GHVQ01030014.1~~GHVQ01030014.1.p1  ORF type:complete len:361 (-),score=16.18 GHVQ01030014.1:178-1260(-)